MAEIVSRRPCWRCGLAGCLVLALAASAQAAMTSFGDIEIEPPPTPQGVSSHGYFEYVFVVANRSTDRAHTVSLSIPLESSYTIGDSLRDLRRTVRVGANETVHVSLLQPDYPPLAGRDVAVSIDGRLQDRGVQFTPSESVRRYPGYFGSRRAVFTGTSDPLILRSKEVKPLPTTDAGASGGGAGAPAAVFMPSLPPFPPPGPGGGGPAKMPTTKTPSMPGTFRPPAPIKAKPGLPQHGLQFVTEEIVSSNWLAYCRYDGIILTAQKLNELPAAVRTALWQYVETGGALLVLGQTDLRGLSSVAMKKQEKGWTEVRAGFGVCRICPDANYGSWSSERYDALMSDWRSTASPWSSSNRNTHDANREFSVIDDLGVPIKGMFVLMSLFVVCIGPLNIFLLTRWKRRLWLLWTTPLLSLCTCLAVFGYMIISEGWSGRLRSETLTFLDEATHRATTVGWTGVYSPLTPGDGLHFSYETEVVSQRYNEAMRSDARTSTIDWSQDQHFADGWIEARVPALFKVRKSELRRERASLQREPDGRWSMVNGLGAAVRRFWYADAKGQIYKAEDIAPGARAMLAMTEHQTPPTPPIAQNALASTELMAKMKDFALQPQHYLRPGLYLAEIDDTPFLEVALRSARTRRFHGIVVGFGKQGD